LPNLIFDQLDTRGPIVPGFFTPGAIGSVLFPNVSLTGLESGKCLLQPSRIRLPYPNASAVMTRKFADIYCSRLIDLSRGAGGSLLGIPFGPISVNFKQDVKVGCANIPFVFYKQTGAQLEVSRPIFLQTWISNRPSPYALRIQGQAPEISYEPVTGGYHGVVQTATRVGVACYVLYSPGHTFI
jgi:hypothetical protein